MLSCSVLTNSNYSTLLFPAIGCLRICEMTYFLYLSRYIYGTTILYLNITILLLILIRYTLPCLGLFYVLKGTFIIANLGIVFSFSNPVVRDESTDGFFLHIGENILRIFTKFSVQQEFIKDFYGITSSQGLLASELGKGLNFHSQIFINIKRL